MHNRDLKIDIPTAVFVILITAFCSYNILENIAFSLKAHESARIILIETPAEHKASATRVHDLLKSYWSEIIETRVLETPLIDGLQLPYELPTIIQIKHKPALNVDSFSNDLIKSAPNSKLHIIDNHAQCANQDHRITHSLIYLALILIAQLILYRDHSNKPTRLTEMRVYALTQYFYSQKTIYTLEFLMLVAFTIYHSATHNLVHTASCIVFSGAISLAVLILAVPATMDLWHSLHRHRFS